MNVNACPFPTTLPCVSAVPNTLKNRYLPHNPITTLPAGVFDSLAEMTVLDISYIDLTTLAPGVFDSLTKLTNLELENNALSSLPPGVFDSLTELTNL